MRKVLLSIFASGILISIGLIAPATGSAEVNVNVTIPLPGLFIPAPPPLLVVPGTYVYYPPDVNVDIFFFHGYWYRPYRGGWYIANSYNGPWHGVGPRRVPPALLNVPPAYRRMPPGHERVPYGTVQKNWRTWERDRYWDHDRGGRGERVERGERGGRGERYERGDRGERRERGRGEGREGDHGRGRRGDD